MPWWGGFYLLSFLQRPVSVGLRVLGHTKGMFLATASSAIVAVTLSYPLISNWWACTAPCLLSVSCKLREWRWWHSRFAKNYSASEAELVTALTRFRSVLLSSTKAARLGKPALFARRQTILPVGFLANPFDDSRFQAEHIEHLLQRSGYGIERGVSQYQCEVAQGAA